MRMKSWDEKDWIHCPSGFGCADGRKKQDDCTTAFYCILRRGAVKREGGSNKLLDWLCPYEQDRRVGPHRKSFLRSPQPRTDPRCAPPRRRSAPASLLRAGCTPFYFVHNRVSNTIAFHGCRHKRYAPHRRTVLRHMPNPCGTPPPMISPRRPRFMHSPPPQLPRTNGLPHASSCARILPRSRFILIPLPRLRDDAPVLHRIWTRPRQSCRPSGGSPC